LPAKPGTSSRGPVSPRVRYSVHIPGTVQDEGRLENKKMEKRLSGGLGVDIRESESRIKVR
jgi:hypothetical protein